MLAYVFWHHRSADISASLYREKLIGFHEALKSSKPKGFIGSFVFQSESLSWLKTELEVYEEWYLTEGSYALDQLNVAAVTGRCMEPHEQVARLAGAGTAGLLLLRKGKPNLKAVRNCYWFGKPSGVTYPQFYAQMEGVMKGGAALWGRQMVLGPTPEFCLHQEGAVKLPPELQAVKNAVKLVYAGE